MKIAIASGKGGTGKTTLAVNLALYASRQRATQLLDLDVEEPNSGIFVASEPESSRLIYRFTPVWDQLLCTACGACVSNCAFGALVNLAGRIMVLPGLCHSCYACSELCPSSALPMKQASMGVLSYSRLEALEFMEARLDIGIEQAAGLIKEAIKDANGSYDKQSYQFRDCPPGTSCPLLAAVTDADYVILVTEPSPFGLNDLSLAVETMRHLGKEMGVVINRNSPNNHKLLQYLQDEKLELLASFDQDRQIAEHYSKGKLLLDDFPDFAAKLQSILKRLHVLEQIL